MVSRKLPSELEEEILIRVPPLSLARFRAVSKQWNALFNDTIFVNNHLARARSHSEFMLQTASKIYSVSFNLNDEDPNIKVRELTSSDIPGLALATCDGFFYSHKTVKTAAVWNPWLRQTRLIEIDQMPTPFFICGMGYDSSRPEKSYKIVGYTIGRHGVGQPILHVRYAIYEFASNAWKFIDDPIYTEKSTEKYYSWHNNVSLNGNLYWITYNLETRQFLIQMLDCSKEIVKPFCILPCEKKDSYHTPVLTAFKGNRFSLLDPCQTTRKIEIWVTKKKIINGDDGDDVEWIKFMIVSIPNLPILYQVQNSRYLVAANIYGKSFVMCCRDKNSQACVYIVRGGMCREIKLDDVVAVVQKCSVYTPSLIFPSH